MQRGEQHPTQALGSSRMEGRGTVRPYCSHLRLQGLDKMLPGSLQALTSCGSLTQESGGSWSK